MLVSESFWYGVGLVLVLLIDANRTISAQVHCKENLQRSLTIACRSIGGETAAAAPASYGNLILSPAMEMVLLLGVDCTSAASKSAMRGGNRGYRSDG